MSQNAVEIAVDPDRIGDKHYRYQMPSILTKVEGNGNGIKTVFPNLVDVANAIGRPAEVLNKFFGSELGALSNYIKADEKFLVMGSFQRDIIQQRVYVFIRKYVLCTRCRNPETTLSIKKKSLISTCGSCGHKGDLGADRTVALLMQYIDANPTATTMSGAARATGDAGVDAAQAAADEKAAKKAKKDKKKAEAEAAEGGAGAGASADLLTATEDKAVVGTDVAAADPRPVVIAALKAAGDDVDATATSAVHHQKQMLALAPDQVIRLVIQCVIAAAAPEKPLGAIMRRAGFIRNFREIGPDAPIEILAELESQFVKARGSPEKMAMAVVLLMDEEVLLRSDLDTYKAQLERKERKAIEKAGGVPPATKSRQRLVLDALEPIFDWTQVTTN